MELKAVEEFIMDTVASVEARKQRLREFLAKLDKLYPHNKDK
jgi:hypothetical protein